MENVLVLDNGAGDIKAALINSPTSESPNVKELSIPNALTKPGKTALSYPASKLGSSRRPNGMLVGAEMWDAPDFGGMSVRRAHERGILTSFDTERDIWLSLLSKDRGIGLTSRKITGLLLTEPTGTPMHTRIATDELIFEEFSFHSLSVMPASRLVASGTTALILDTGFSCSTATPIINGFELSHATRRLSIGGKALTNQLKTTVSYRSWNMMDEPVVMNGVKERCCYVAMKFSEELERYRNRKELTIDYILPDTSTIGSDPLGHIRGRDEQLEGGEQVLVMGNERVCVPELLFTPSDAGMKQAGVAELCVQAIEACPEESRPALCANIILVGGNTRFKNFRRRFEHELRPLINEFYDVNVRLSDDPVLEPLRNGVKMVLDESMVRPYTFVTKSQYEEEGSRRIAAKFFSPDNDNLQDGDDDDGDDDDEMAVETDSE